MRVAAVYCTYNWILPLGTLHESRQYLQVEIEEGMARYEVG